MDGVSNPRCVSVAYTQTAYVMQCGGPYSLDGHCGTFLELHAPNDTRILAQTRLLSGYPNGYRTTTLPLFYQGDKERVVCRGKYEIWYAVLVLLPVGNICI